MPTPNPTGSNASASDEVTATAQSTPLLDNIVALMIPNENLKDTKNSAQVDYARQMINMFATDLVSTQVDINDPDKDNNIQSMLASISERIAGIDMQINAQLNLILHNPELQKLEASWRGLHQLVSNTETGTSLKLRLFNTTKEELRQDLDKSVEFDQSILFKKVYEDEYGTFGGSPFSVLMGDFEFGRSTQDIKMLTDLSNVAAAAHAPFITAASPSLFDLKSFADLGVPRDLAKVFESGALIQWRAFRDTEDSRYVSMVLPRYLSRLPYDPVKNPAPGMSTFFEDVSRADAIAAHADTTTGDPSRLTGEAASKAITEAAVQEAAHIYAKAKEDPDAKLLIDPDSDKFVWGNAAWLLTQRITDAFAQYRWCAAIRGPEGGGAVNDLPVYLFDTLAGDLAIKCPTEVAITDRREKELDSLGFIALCHRKNTNIAVFFGGQTTNKPKSYNTFEANANARISGMLPYILAASRFAHYLKVILRDKVGSFATRDNVQTYLNNWIADYVLINDNAPQEIKAQYPLREARIDVTDVPGRPGSYRATVFLRPHFQLEELTASIRLVAALPAPATA